MILLDYPILLFIAGILIFPTIADFIEVLLYIIFKGEDEDG